MNQVPKSANLGKPAPAMPPLPPNTIMLSCETDWHRAVWMHGTSAASLPAIARDGLRPRGERPVESNWDHESSENVVYLTSCYALHYARAAVEADGGGAALHAILDLDLAKLDAANFFGDEDAYALSTVQGFEHLDERSLEERVAFWRDNIQLTDANTSLRVLGNACYAGVIPPAAVKRVRLLTSKEAMAMTLQISDPVVAPKNFRMLGGAAQRFHKWLLGYDTELNWWFEQIVKPSIPLMSLDEAAKHLPD